MTEVAPMLSFSSEDHSPDRKLAPVTVPKLY